MPRVLFASATRAVTAAILVSCICSVRAAAQNDTTRWWPTATDRDNSVSLFIDLETLRHRGDTVAVRVRMQYQPPRLRADGRKVTSSVVDWVIDCKARAFQQRAEIDYDGASQVEDTATPTSWQSIAPRTVAERNATTACGMRPYDWRQVASRAWVRVVSDTSVELYIDSGTIRRSGDTVSAWRLLGVPHGEFQHLELAQYDCAGRRLRELESLGRIHQDIAEQEAPGSLSSWTDVDEALFGPDVLKKVCALARWQPR